MEGGTFSGGDTVEITDGDGLPESTFSISTQMRGSGISSLQDTSVTSRSLVFLTVGTNNAHRYLQKVYHNLITDNAHTHKHAL